ncbi:MAG: trigger factor [Chlamydiota bacterium]
MTSETASEHFANTHVDITVHHKPHCVAEFTVKASPEFVKALHNKAVKEVTKEVSMPGFRKGKAPEHLILKSHESAIDKQWQQIIGNDAFRECEVLTKILPLNENTRIQYRLQSHSLSEGAEMTFAFESEPQVPTINPEELSLTPVEKETVDQKKIDDTLYKIRLFFAKWHKVSDRAVQDKDFVTIDLDSLEKESPERIASNTRLEIDPSMTPWMYNLILGMNIGESREGLSELDSKASEEDKASFTPKKVRITLLSIEEPELPPVDDHFTKMIGAENVEIMKERLTILLTKQALETQHNAYHDQLSHLLTEKFMFEIPGSLLHSEMQHRLSQLFQNESFKERFGTLSEDAKKEEIDKVKVHAEAAIRLFYLCKKIAFENKIVIHPSELNPKITSPLDAMFADHELANPNKTEEQKNLMTSKLLLNKALEFLLSKILK